jgi:AcrR family transcriptional regulator
MARIKDETKRQSILESSKMLFSHKGFFNTSISDIVRETGFPVGTIYTYFKSKDEIIKSIVEERWQQWYEQLEKTLAAEPGPELKIRILIDRFLPDLFEDLDFINILFSEAIQYTRIEEKLEKLTDLAVSLIKPFTARSQALLDLSRGSLQAALIIFFLGILDAARLARKSSIGLKESHIIGFTKMLVESTFDVKLS